MARLTFQDTEPRSAHPQSWLDMNDPLIDFGKFVNDESIEQEDLFVIHLVLEAPFLTVVF